MTTVEQLAAQVKALAGGTRQEERVAAVVVANHALSAAELSPMQSYTVCDAALRGLGLSYLFAMAKHPLPRAHDAALAFFLHLSAHPPLAAALIAESAAFAELVWAMDGDDGRQAQLFTLLRQLATLPSSAPLRSALPREILARAAKAKSARPVRVLSLLCDIGAASSEVLLTASDALALQSLLIQSMHGAAPVLVRTEALHCCKLLFSPGADSRWTLARSPASSRCFPALLVALVSDELQLVVEEVLMGGAGTEARAQDALLSCRRYRSCLDLLLAFLQCLVGAEESTHDAIWQSLGSEDLLQMKSRLDHGVNDVMSFVSSAASMVHGNPVISRLFYQSVAGIIAYAREDESVEEKSWAVLLSLLHCDVLLASDESAAGMGREASMLLKVDRRRAAFDLLSYVLVVQQGRLEGKDATQRATIATDLSPGLNILLRLGAYHFEQAGLDEGLHTLDLQIVINCLQLVQVIASTLTSDETSARRREQIAQWMRNLLSGLHDTGNDAETEAQEIIKLSIQSLSAILSTEQ